MGASHLHHSGLLVVFKQKRPLDTARCNYDRPRADLYISLVETVALNAVLHGRNNTVAVGANRRRVFEKPDIAVFGNKRGQCRGPFEQWRAVEQTRPVFNEPPIQGLASNKITDSPVSAAASAAQIPAGPPPITQISQPG